MPNFRTGIWDRKHKKVLSIVRPFFALFGTHISSIAPFLFCPLLNHIIATVFQIVNITKAGPRSQQQPVNIYFAVRGSRGFLLGSEVTNLLLRLTMVEFSYYMGFPVLEIAERKS